MKLHDVHVEYRDTSGTTQEIVIKAENTTDAQAIVFARKDCARVLSAWWGISPKDLGL